MYITRTSVPVILLMMISLFVTSSIYGQKELWGYRAVAENSQIVKVPLDGTSEDVAIIHSFDPTGILGRNPRGRLLQASNGKLYGIATSQGGQDIPYGVLFEYNPVTEEYRVLNNTVINGSYSAPIEPLPGWIYGTTNGERSVFKYNIETEEASIVATIPEFPYQLGTLQPNFNGELMKASDGYLYITTSMAPSAQNAPYPGGIYRINMGTGQLTKVFVFSADGSDVMDPVFGTKLVETSPGKLYGTSLGGSHVGPQGVAPGGSGTIFEYTIATATIVKKYDFDYNVNGRYPSPIIKDGNKLYGTLPGFSDDSQDLPNRRGSLFEYDLVTGTMTLLHNFTQADDQMRSPGGMLLKASNGKFYTGALHGNYEVDPAAGTVVRKVTDGSAYSYQPLIEICSKPSYVSFEVSAFTACEGTSFSFDIENSNATGYVWKKGSTVLPSQTTGVLNIDSITLANTGIYTCTMTNECGTTVTMPLQLTVDTCMGVDDVSGLNAVKLYPNPVTNILNLQLPDTDNFEMQKVFIINMLGQTVYSGAGKTTAIDVSSLPTGMYQLVLTTDKGDWNGKFIKQ
jgi:Secretion system C-terminal sorting domain